MQEAAAKIQRQVINLFSFKTAFQLAASSQSQKAFIGSVSGLPLNLLSDLKPSAILLNTT
jgi:hypothetical protein